MRSTVIRIARIGDREWRFGHGVSPVVIASRFQGNTAPGDETPVRRSSRGEFQLMAPRTTPAESPGTYPLGDPHDAELTIQKDDVDRKPHPNGVNAPQRVRQEQTRVLVDTCSPQQTACTTGTETRRDVDLWYHHLSRFGIDEFEHGAIVMRRDARRTCLAVAECNAMRAHCTSPVPECCPPLPLRYAPRMLCEDFHSGDDVTLGFLGRTYSFAQKDFEQRVVRAAVELELAARPISRGERSDVVQAAIAGQVTDPRSEVGERIAELQALGGEDPVYWLRKLVFRSAWLDHRIKHGQVDVAFDDSVGAFRIEPGKYPLPGSGHPSFAVTEASA